MELLDDSRIGFNYVSEGCADLLEVSPDYLCDNPEFFKNLIHAEDATSFMDALLRSAQTHSALYWRGRIVLPNDKIKWISINSNPQHNDKGITCWNGMMLDITAAKLDELAYRQTQQQLQEFSAHLHDAKEQERLHIAREVHDEIGSLLTAIKIDLSWLTQRLVTKDKLLTEKINTLAMLVNNVITSANNLAHRLRPGALDQLGFMAAIEIETLEFSKRSDIICTLTSSHDDIELASSHSITLFRILQETLNNILKHAQAKHVQVEVVMGVDHLEMIISDDGIGFSNSARNKPRSFGLRGIYERVAFLGGTVKIASTAGSGTQIAIFIPLETADPSSTTPLK